VLFNDKALRERIATLEAQVDALIMMQPDLTDRIRISKMQGDGITREQRERFWAEHVTQGPAQPPPPKKKGASGGPSGYWP